MALKFIMKLSFETLDLMLILNMKLKMLWRLNFWYVIFRTQYLARCPFDRKPNTRNQIRNTLIKELDFDFTRKTLVAVYKRLYLAPQEV
jgi:hypothetical protein